MSSADNEAAPGDEVLSAADREYLSRYLSEEALADFVSVLRYRSPAMRAAAVHAVRERAETSGDRAWFLALSDIVERGGGLPGGDP